MTITSQEIIEDREQADGSRHIAFRFTFHNRLIIDKRFLAASDYNAETGKMDMVPFVEQQVIDNEINNLIAAAEQNGTDILDAEPVHPETDTLANRKKMLVKRALRYIANERDVKLARLIFYKAWNYLANQSAWTPSQIAEYLGISIGVLSRINDRFQWIHDNLAGIDADDGFVGEVE